MKKADKLFKYFEKLTGADTKESSKRFVFIYIILVLVTYIVLRFTDKSNLELVLGELLAFAGTLAYVATKHKKSINTKDEQDEKTND